jgi:hypothetical protein
VLFDLEQSASTYPCVDGPRFARRILAVKQRSSLQSCVRPFTAALRPLALMGVRKLGPHRPRGFDNPGYVPGYSQLVGTADHSITPVPLANISTPSALSSC